MSLALITGATSGIGEGVAKLFASKGISLLLTGRNHEKLAELKQELSELVDVHTLAADLSTDAGRNKIINWMKEKKPDLVINNAGYGLYGEIIAHHTEELIKMVELDITSVMALTVEAAKEMVLSKQKGVIVNISSAAAYQIYPNFALYASSKTFVLSLSRAIDFELRDQGVRVLTFCPGRVATGFSSKAGGAIKSPQFMVMDVEKIANAIWHQIKKGKQVCIYDWKYRILTYLSSFIPASWLARSLKRSIPNP